MKKITVLVLVLGLAVPVNAISWFKRAEEPEIIEKTNYVVTAVSTVAGALLTLVCCLIGGKVYLTKRIKEFPLPEPEAIEDIKKEAREHLMEEINFSMNEACCTITYDKCADRWCLALMPRLSEKATNVEGTPMLIILPDELRALVHHLVHHNGIQMVNNVPTYITYNTEEGELTPQQYFEDGCKHGRGEQLQLLNEMLVPCKLRIYYSTPLKSFVLGYWNIDDKNAPLKPISNAELKWFVCQLSRASVSIAAPTTVTNTTEEGE
jgi:hypothetical protein